MTGVENCCSTITDGEIHLPFRLRLCLERTLVRRKNSVRPRLVFLATSGAWCGWVEVWTFSSLF